MKKNWGSMPQYILLIMLFLLDRCCKLNYWSCYPSKHFNVVSTLPLSWYDVVTLGNAKPMLEKRYIRQRWSLQRWTMLDKRCIYVNVDINNVNISASKKRYHFQCQVLQCWRTSKLVIMIKFKSFKIKTRIQYSLFELQIKITWNGIRWIKNFGNYFKI